MNNEKGSVLSIALIVIAILSFSITTTTAYTSSVANRSNELVQDRSTTNEVRSVLNQAFFELKSFINFELGADDFTDPDTQLAIQDFVHSTLYPRYQFEQDNQTYGLDVVFLDAGETYINYRVKYHRPDQGTLYRDLFVSLVDRQAPDDPNEATDIIWDAFKNSVPDDYILKCDGDCDYNQLLDELNVIDRYTGNGFHLMNLDSSVLIQGDLETAGHHRQGVLDLMGNALLIEGNLTFESLNTIRSTSDTADTGVLIVLGNLTFEQKFDLTIEDNILIIVKGNTYFNIDGPGNNNNHNNIDTASGGRFAWLTLKSHPDEDVFESGLIGGDVTIEDHPEFVYFGNESFTYDYDADWASLLFSYNIAFPPGYSFLDGSLKELELEE